jgi:two-component system, OmpR family, sensor kinase
MRLDHELKNPLTAIWAGLANIEQTGGMILASAATAAAPASVSVQADRIARLVSDLRKLADTRAGIPADEIGQVWQELARGRAARSLPGTGIGLALVRVIVVRHGGQVAARWRSSSSAGTDIRATSTRCPNLRIPG